MAKVICWDLIKRPLAEQLLELDPYVEYRISPPFVGLQVPGRTVTNTLVTAPMIQFAGPNCTVTMVDQQIQTIEALPRPASILNDSEEQEEY